MKTTVEKLREALGEIIAINDESAGEFRKRGGTRRGLSIVTARDALVQLAAIEAACLSGADALVREKQTCGNCKHLKYPGPYRAACGNPDSPFRGAVFNSYEAPNHDGCIKGWATREAE